MSNSENITKSSSSSETITNNENNPSKLDHRNIEMNEFLDFLKISYNVNDLISNTKRKVTSSTVAKQTAGAPDFEIDFDKLAANEMLKELYGSRKTEKDRRDGSGDQRGQSQVSPPVSVADCKAEVKNSTSNDKRISSAASRKSRTKLNEKLQHVIDEGVLDSILPYVCPPVAIAAPVPYKITISKTKVMATSENSMPDMSSVAIPPSEKGNVAAKESLYSPTESPSAGRLKSAKQISKPRKSLGCNKSNPSIPNLTKKPENDVVIHVCDEAKNTSKDFTCPQQLLITKMKYFADVTAGQKLQDMDISVHCDVQIFEWLMKWVKQSTDELEAGPQFDSTNVIPILVSANFLQMEPLLIDCLTFCHSHLSDIVRSSTNLSCLNDSITTRLAAMFTNLELEMVKDKRERFTPRLWIKLIQSIFEPEPQVLRGHFFSLAGLFRCSKCGKCLTHTIKAHINCAPPSNIRLNRWGQLISQHTRDLTWNVSTHITCLFKELKSWRKVYWKLWGYCHFLYCCICEAYFPVYQMTWCRFHPETAQFLGPISEGRTTGPAGRYPCCGQQAFRYEPLPGSNGCQFREHNVLIESDRDRSILSLVQIASEGGALFEVPPQNYAELPRNIGMSLNVTRARQGLLPTLYPADFHPKQLQRSRMGASCNAGSSSDSDLEKDQRQNLNKNRKHQSSTLHKVVNSDGCESDDSCPTEMPTFKNNRRRPTDSVGRYWCGDMSARRNQDNQREFEEKVMKQVISIVNRKTGADVDTSQSTTSTGGSYLRLEAEWKEQMKIRNGSVKPKIK